jgi:hypothetical protein
MQGLSNDKYGNVSISENRFISNIGNISGGIFIGDSVLPINIRNNFFSNNTSIDYDGAKDIYYASKDLINEAGGILKVT